MYAKPHMRRPEHSLVELVLSFHFGWELYPDHVLFYMDGQDESDMKSYRQLSLNEVYAKERAEGAVTGR